MNVFKEVTKAMNLVSMPLIIPKSINLKVYF